MFSPYENLNLIPIPKNQTIEMTEFAQKLYEQILSELEELDRDRYAFGNISDRRLSIITAAIDQLKQKSRTYTFASEEEEIYFLKNKLPLFLSLFIYYSERASIECCARIGIEKSRNEYLELLLQKFDNYFRVNEEFFNYYRFDKTKFDKYYFLRNSYKYNEHTDLPVFMMDLSFCTIYSWKLATIMAYSRLEREIRFGNLEKKTDVIFADNILESELTKLVWTDAKMGLIELMYSLYEQGAFNYGKADIKTITRYFEKVFSVQLSNTSKSFQDILSRKKGYTAYLDKLREKIIGRIDEIEDNNMKR